MPAVLAGGGCGGGGSKKDKIWVYQVPDFYRPQLKRIAVIPFSNHTRVRGVGQTVCDKLSTSLTNNATYEVYTRQHLADVVKEQDAVLAGILSADTAMKIGRLKAVQALVCGDCYRYETATKTETRYNTLPVFGKNSKGKTVITGWKKVPYVWTRHDAYLDCNVVVIDTGTGRQIAAVNEPTHLWAAGSPPKYDAGQLARMALDDQVNRITRALAVTRTRIKLKGKVLRTAVDFYDQEWEWEKKITPADGKFFVVVSLPPEADRNRFKITIVPEEGREVMAEQAFTWTKQYSRFGYQFAVEPIVEKGGLGKYRAKLYSGSEPIARYSFEIVDQR
jgi:hypothetical protein